MAKTKTPSRRPAWRGRDWFRALLLVAAALAAYQQALSGQFLWDDDSWTTNVSGLLSNVSGLCTMWLQPAALQQYYPLTGTTFWLDYHLWGFWPVPYHVENVLLHALAAILFWRLLRRLEVPGAWLAGALFALHPVMVESVGWITERKNVLSLVLYLGALLAYSRFARDWRSAALAAPDAKTPGPKPRREIPESRGPRVEPLNQRRGTANSQQPTSNTQCLPFAQSMNVWRWMLDVGCSQGPRGGRAYAWALLLFLGALLAKATAFSFPAVVLLICWWKRGRLRWRTDVLPVLPFFALTLGLGLLTAWLERTHVGAQGQDWAFSLPERCLIAGRALWFYAGKMIWPVNLTFIYPRWQLDSGVWWQWLFPLSALGVVAALWFARRRLGRGPLVAVLFFAGTLFPVLGFMNVYAMRFSFVCDHWVYLSSLGLIALGAALVARLARQLGRPGVVYSFAAVVLPMLGVLTWRQGGLYADSETLWRETLARNPACCMACINLGESLDENGQIDAAMSQYREAIRLDPAYPEAYNNLGNALLKKGQVDEAIRHYQAAIRRQPNYVKAHYNLGNAQFSQGQVDEAIVQYQKAIRLNPDYPDAHNSLGFALSKQNRMDEAITQYRQALRLQPDYAEAHNNLGFALATKGQMAEAIHHFQEIIRLKADNADTHYNLGTAFGKQGRMDEAIRQFQETLRRKPEYAEAHYNLGIALVKQGQTDEAIRQFEEALRLKPDYPIARDHLARALETSTASAKPTGRFK